MIWMWLWLRVTSADGRFGSFELERLAVFVFGVKLGLEINF